MEIPARTEMIILCVVIDGVAKDDGMIEPVDNFVCKSELVVAKAVVDLQK